MNTYGDSGNALTLMKRAKLHGLNPILHHYHVGGELPENIDIVIGGGGQDTAQSEIQVDIKRIAEQLHTLANNNIPMLMVCGTYQLFGHRFVTKDGAEIQGIGILDVETFGGDTRMIGNIAIETRDFGVMYGFENHSGKTILGPGQLPLGKVTRGNGNNGDDKTEGARTNNVFGTYMHGPVLPNNPVFTDNLISLAATKKDSSFKLQTVDDSLSELARSNAVNRKH
jgi:CobQ-like glutamine amidotransferase family enzyme